MIGEVFVKEVVPGGQADKLGIFEVGDRLQGIGELTFTDGGFEKAVEMVRPWDPETIGLISDLVPHVFFGRSCKINQKEQKMSNYTLAVSVSVGILSLGCRLNRLSHF